VRSILASIALNQRAREIQMVLMDPVGTAFQFLTGSPLLLGDIATTPERGLQHLRWLENELDRRESERVARPRLVVVVDGISEFLTQSGREFQVHLGRIAQRGRGAGISLILCTHKSNAGDLGPSLRSNFPVRLVGKNAGTNDGADRLAGRGDFMLVAGGERVRFQSAYLAPEDVNAFQRLMHANQPRSASNDGRLGGLVNRLRRIK
jgi:S-DNA-T family DNA segregation ATPase FtsK/SpoIIIE